MGIPSCFLNESASAGLPLLAPEGRAAGHADSWAVDTALALTGGRGGWAGAAMLIRHLPLKSYPEDTEQCEVRCNLPRSG